MTPDELRAAVVPFLMRVGACGGSIPEAIANSPAEAAGMVAAALEAARQWLLEHPPDDGDTVDADWLKAVGFEAGRFSADLVRGPLVRGLSLAGDDYWLVRTFNIPPQHRPRTRGQVRRLCSALGVPLTEPSPCPTPSQSSGPAAATGCGATGPDAASS